MRCVEVSGDGWSASLPAGWHAPDATRPQYLESPDGSAGVYFRHLKPKDQDLLTAARRLHDVGLGALPGGQESWQVKSQEVVGPDRVDLLASFYKASDQYLICSRIVSQTGSVVQMTFHDYLCEDSTRSTHDPHAWLASLRVAPRHTK